MVGTEVIVPEVSVVFPSTKLCPPDLIVPPRTYMPISFFVTVLPNARTVPLALAVIPE